MHRVLAMLLLLVTASTGCLLNTQQSDPDERIESLLFQSEDRRSIKQILNEWHDQNERPSMKYERVHGGIGGP